MATVSLHTQPEEVFKIRTTDGNIFEIKADAAIVDTIGSILEIFEEPCIRIAVFNWSQVVSINTVKKEPGKTAYVNANGKFVKEVVIDE